MSNRSKKRRKTSEESKQQRLTERQIQRRRKRKKEIKKAKERKMLFSIIALIVIILFVFGIISSCINKTISNLKDPSSPSQQGENTSQINSQSSSDDIPDNGENGYLTEQGVYIWNNKAYETFQASNGAAASYAGAISHYKNKLGSNVAVYNLVVPTHTAFGLPDRLEKTVVSTDQKKYLDNIFKSYSSKVNSINVYDIFEEKKKEALYLNTDHRWTSLGAYYAYEKFCEVADETPVKLSELTSNKITNYVGSLYKSTNAEVLINNPDTITYYDIPKSYTISVLKNNSSEWKEYRNVYNEAVRDYNLFIYGDNAVTKIVNDSSINNKKILVVKDSYGNAFVPWLVNNYDEVHSIDFRLYNGNIINYVAKNDISIVLFINSTVNSSVSSQIDKMSALFA
ncbi:MAG: DHHW family protein [Acutalibacteraceae bacterium]|nr:DHHW family protein [Acutalibacteraceae bacterium]